LIILNYSCNSPKSNYGNKKVFRYNESKNIATLDPAFARNYAAIWPINQLYNGLVQIDDSLNIKPCIAKNWKISDGGKTYSFVLRNDVYFHDGPLFKNGMGRKVIAYDFVYSFSRLLNPSVASPGAWVFNFVDTAKSGTVKGFKAVNDSVFNIYLKASFPPFIGLLTMPYCFVVPKEVVNFYGKDFRNHPLGTGPFKFKRWVEGEKLIFIKNDNYFEKDDVGNRLPRIDAVSVTFIADKQSEFLEFIKGRIDFISGINAAFKDELITRSGNLNPNQNGRFKMLRCPYLNTEYLGILIDTSLEITRISPLRFKKIRQAIGYAIDKKKMMTFLRNNIGFPATAGFVPSGMPSFSKEAVKGYSYNPDSSRKLLISAGFPNGKGLTAIKITTSSDYLDICEFVQHELASVGIIAEIDVVTGLAYRDMLANSRMNMFRASWVADYPDAENYFALFYSHNFCPKGPNYTHFKNQYFDKLYEASQNEMDLKKRFQYYYQMDNIITEEAPVIPLFYDVAVRFTQKNISNLGINPLNQLNLKNVVIQ
jgi:peptide/nickel transport system substrate-binding protein